MSFTNSRCKQPNDTKACLEQKITSLQEKVSSDTPLQIYQYQYRNQTVYYIPPRCCDIPGELYDQQCQLICYPDGGITGRGDGTCSDFFDQRTHEVLIWERP